MASEPHSDGPADESILPSLGKAEIGETQAQAESASASAAVKMAAISAAAAAPAPAPDMAPEVESLEPGWILCNRFRIVRFIARGGMGEVYEAEDLDLTERIALKTVLPQIAADARAMDRFKREIQLSRKVTHVNVCRINDLFYHRPAPGDQGPPEVTFLTMELLSGRSLAEHIRANQRLPVAEAVGLAVQIARGLSVAHAAGVVHRDLKSANVMLVPGETGTRAVITDFGLARAMAGSSDQHNLTGSHDIVGTPAYMAPEQIEGGAITAATDLYALGVVLFEMLTGHWPFVAETRLATAMKRLMEAPPSPSKDLPGLDPGIEAVVMRCLARHPAERLKTADEFVRAIQGETVLRPSRPESPQVRVKSRKIPVLAAVLLLATVLAGYFAYRELRKTAPATPAGQVATIKARPVAAVLGFKNVSAQPQYAWVATAMTEILNTELSASEKVRAIPGEEIARMKTELSLSDADTIAGDKLSMLQANLGADYLITGSFLASGKAAENLRVDVRLEDGRGDVVTAFSSSGSIDNLPALGDEIAAALRQKLGLLNLDASQKAGVTALVPANREAGRLYSEALASLRAFDAQAAVESLQKAAALEPDQPSIQLALASGWTLLGYDTRAKEAAQRAFDLVKDREGLPQQFRFLIEGRYHEASHAWSKAIDVYSSLHRFYPDNLEYGLRLGNVQTLGAHGEDALSTYAELRKLPKPWSLDPRIALGEAQANGALSKGEAQLKAATQAAERAAEIHAALLEAPALVNACIAGRRLGKFDAAMAQCVRAKEIFSVFSDRIGIAFATNNMGNIYRQKGDLLGARNAYEQALAMGTAVAAKRHMAGALSNIGDTYYLLGDMPHAREYFQRSLVVSREIDDRKNQTTALNNLAEAYDFEGDLSHAQRIRDEVVVLARQSSDRRGLALALYNQALEQFDLGELDRSRRNYEEALRLWKELGDKEGIVLGNTRESELLAALGDEGGARRRLDEAEAVAKDTKSEAMLASVQLFRAFAALAGGRYDDADRYASQAAAVLRQEKDADEGEALIISARALLAQGKDATASLTRFEQLGSKFKAVQLKGQIARAEAAGRAGKIADATASLRKTADEASRLGLVKIECDARLALASIPAIPKETRRSEAKVVAFKAKHAGFTVLGERAATVVTELR